ncbi:unnamed protein product [Owenia fusiformis]|uniref:xanthine dehydrogenase n=1 Tax=Owenia fusiformis TaxID=6347 RepID=A0A8J1U7X1_OWEFU|nr:unnamed protein product [Owenia fusiformis]
MAGLEQSGNTLVFFVNGKKITDDNPEPEETLLSYIRNKLKLTGSKLGCGEGGCGACTVMISRYDRQSKQIQHFSVNACLAPVCSVHGMAVTTVEGIGSTKTRLHPVQERISRSHGSQCGFCTPGIVMSMYTLLRNTPLPSTNQMQHAFEGNLCRCTGYRPILDGFKTFTKEFKCQMGENCCRNKPAEDMQIQENGLDKDTTFTSYDPTQEPIFPSELQLTDKYDKMMMSFRGERTSWFRPVTIAQLLDVKANNPNAKLVCGNTEIGVETKFKGLHYPVLISATHVPELTCIEYSHTGVTIGASTTLNAIHDSFQEKRKQLKEYETRVMVAINEMLQWFAGQQIRNVAAIGGNIMTGSPISDLNPIFMAAGSTLTLQSLEGSRKVAFDENFYTAYRKNIVRPDEILVSIFIPYTSEKEYFYAYKQANRKEDDIAIVNAGMKVRLDDEQKVQKMSLAFGGMAPTTVLALGCCNKAIGRTWDDKLLEDVCHWLENDLPLSDSAPGGQIQYRRTLTTSFFFKFFLQVKSYKVKLHGKDLTAIKDYEWEERKSVQIFEKVPEGQQEIDPVGRPVPHVSAAKQATGEAIYCDDMPHYSDELYIALVLSTVAHGKILSVDTKMALEIPGIVGYVDHTDVPGSNDTGPAALIDEEIYRSEMVTCQGQIIGAIVADTQAHAQRAAKLVKIQYETYDPIITIKEAIAKDSYFPTDSVIVNGDVESALKEVENTLEGEIHLGSQEHFYLETNAVIAVPKGEDGEMEIFASTQNPTTTQMLAARALGVPASHVVCRVKRMGGGFGGKETRSIPALSLPAVVAAQKFGRPVRCMLDRDEDMLTTGTRHPLYAKYKIGFTAQGRIEALDVDLYLNAGCSTDLSAAVMERAMFHSDSCYKIPNVRVKGHLCKTNIPSNTAFRGFGGPQGLMVCENWISDVASKLGISQTKVREMNMYKEGDKTHYNQTIERCNIESCWKQVLEQSNYHKRLEQIDEYNRESRWRKRGIAAVPTKFGIAFTATFLNQAGALVHVYTDGSVLLTHGGCEMGQGLHTKMIQVASKTLGVSAERIHISETSTNTVPNTSATAASASSDLNGMAVLQACQTIKDRLQPFVKAKPEGTWNDWVNAAYFDRVSLSASGFYKTPNLGYDWETNSGNPFNYFSFGAAVSEVEIDCLTGDHKVLKTDIVMDLGSSLNPVIDIGQIEGAFAQGYGLFTLEQHKYSPNGTLLTRGPGAYKIPGFGDVPIEFNVTLLKDSPNPKAVYSSKAIGEPPLILASTVFYAIKHAITSARADTGVTGVFRLDSPASSERIRMACSDEFTKQFPEPKEGSFTPWFVQH